MNPRKLRSMVLSKEPARIKLVTDAVVEGQRIATEAKGRPVPPWWPELAPLTKLERRYVMQRLGARPA